MRIGQERVMQAFCDGKAKTESAFSTDGTAVYSYGMEIARRLKTGKVLYLLPPSQGGPGVSDTTSQHLGACASVCADLPKSEAFTSEKKYRTRLKLGGRHGRGAWGSYSS